MFINPQLKYRLNKLAMTLLFQKHSLNFYEQATNKYIVAAGYKQKSKSAIFLDGELENIKQVCLTRDAKLDLLSIHGAELSHHPTIRYEFTNVELFDGRIYKNASKIVNSNKEKNSLNKKSELLYFDEGFLAGSYSGNEYFGPFLREDLALALMLEETEQNINTRLNKYTHEDGYRELLSITPPENARNAFVKKLVIHQDFGQNYFKRERYEILRDRLRRKVSKHENTYSNIYIKRGVSGVKREISNSEALDAFLITRGFKIIEPEKMQPIDIARALLNANIVIGVEGSHLSHSIYPIKDGGSIIVLQPPNRFSMVLKDFTDCLDMNFGFLVGTEKEGGNFEINIQRLDELIDKVENNMHYKAI